jgi:hypothetical protein
MLSAPPSRAFAQGLLVRVTAVSRRTHHTRAKVVGASIYEVAPNMSFDVTLAFTSTTADYTFFP